MSILVERLDNLHLLAEPKRVLLRPYATSGPEHAGNLVSRVLALPESEVPAALQSVMAQFDHRHRHLHARILRRFEQLGRQQGRSQPLSEPRRALLGASFSSEYSLECAALFNPSIVPHPDQTGLEPGSLRFIMSLRATGEGHVSSITFRSGVIDAQGHWNLDAESPFVVEPTLIAHDVIQFNLDQELSERVIFPITPSQCNGIEDARFMRFEGGTYYGTYTAYDGRQIQPQLLETRDFLTFRFIPLVGPAVRNKGMALFPRKIDGLYTMLGRQDGENLHLMVSPDIHSWQDSRIIARPQYLWEIVQIGNCGSPIETEAGWLVLTHGVGPMRQYSIGALLLDRQDPSKVIGRLKEPLLSPTEDEREGYVPNVVYSCGGLIHADHLILPYGVSDSATKFARVELKALLKALT